MHAEATYPDRIEPLLAREEHTRETEASHAPKSEARSESSAAESEGNRAPREASFAASLLGDAPMDEKSALRDGAKRFGAALALSAAYGLAIGTRDGGVSI